MTTLATTRRFFLNTILLGGETPAKIAAASAAGFASIEVWEEDVSSLNGGASAMVDALATAQLGITDFQVLRDFDGASVDQRADRRDTARRMLDTAVALGADTLQAPSNTREDMVAEAIPEDLAWLAGEAAQRGLSIAYEPMAWSMVNHTLPQLWASVVASGAGNINVVVDAFHLFSRGRTISDLDGIPVSRIANVQFCDGVRMGPIGDAKNEGKHHRLLPGDGVFPLVALADWLVQARYAGPVGIEVFNDELKGLDPMGVAVRAMGAMKGLWGGR